MKPPLRLPALTGEPLAPGFRIAPLSALWTYGADGLILTAMQAAPLTNLAEFTVSELSSAIKRTVEEAFGLVRLRGEISGYRGVHGSGHVYLCLKDDRAKIDGVIWRSTLASLKFMPEEGLEVFVTGRVTTFPGKSTYQIVIEQLEPAGAGALMALLEERRKRLAAEGLFDEARKKPLPFWPHVIGIVTSPAGAVIRDMLHGFEERCPSHVVIWPARVQGETCGAEVAAAISGFNLLAAGGPIPRPDLIIVARGGGSLEDLWGFSDEACVRAAAASRIPLISAVGHETDWTLIDLAADARAPTPTKAAEWAVPKRADLAMRLAESSERGRRTVRYHLERRRVELRGAERGLPRPLALLAVPRQRLDGVAAALGWSLRGFAHEARSRFERSANWLSPRLLAAPIRRQRERLLSVAMRAAQSRTLGFERKHGRLGALTQLLHSLSHKSVLERGFALVRGGDGRMIARAAPLRDLETVLDIEFADGHVAAQTGRAGLDKMPPAPRAARFALRRGAATKKDESGQGSLL